jgi:hypothetical protein
LEHRSKPHRAEGRIRVCARLDRIIPGSRRPRSGDGERCNRGALACADRRRGRALLDFDRKVLDLAAYGKFVDNFAQNFGSILVSLGPQSIAVQGIGESQLGADASASASLSLSNTVRVYLNYDGRFRSALQSHQGTVGLEVKW